MTPQGKWVEFPTMECAPIVRCEFDVERFQSAKIRISGLGLFFLYINGKRVGNDRFVPAQTDYHRRELNQLAYPINGEFTHRIFWVEYDLTEYLTYGRNALAVLLGNGWYNQQKRTAEGVMGYGYPRLFYELDVTLENGDVYRLASNESLRWNRSYITANNLFMGECQDLNLFNERQFQAGFDDATWETARPAREYEFLFEKQEVPGDRVIRSLTPKLLGEHNGRRIFDSGENITGVVRLKLLGKKGERVLLRFSEELENESLVLDFSTCGGYDQIQTDEFICDGTERSVEPLFTWHGFRYFEVSGAAEVLCVDVIHSPLARKADFHCDHQVLNWYFDAYVRTQQANVHMWVPTDCPHRERLGYTGDGQITADSAMTVFNGKSLYKKWIRDILDCQDRKSGHIRHTAPFMGGGGGPGGWGCAVVTLPYMYFKHYRDKSILSESYSAMCRWVEYMVEHSQDGLVVSEEKYGWCLGDWETTDPVQLPPSFVNSCYLVKSLARMREICEVIGRDFAYDSLIERVKTAITTSFFDAQSGSFIHGVQGADAYALDIGLGDARTLENLVRKYATASEFDTGIFGTEILIRVLFERNAADTALRMLTCTGERSFTTMMNYGASTIHESFEGYRGLGSHNHPMFGGAIASLFCYLAGIREGLDGGILLAPVKQSVVSRFDARVLTEVGEFRVEFEGGTFRVTSPINTEMIYDNRRFAIIKGTNIIGAEDDRV